MSTPERGDGEGDHGRGGQVVAVPGAQPGAAPEVLEAEIVDDSAPQQQLVNPPEQRAPLPWQAGVPLARPVIPPWLADAQTRREATRWVRRYARHAAAFHAVRVPLYVARTGCYALRGVVQLGWGAVGYVTDQEARPLRSAAVRRDDYETYLKLCRARADRVRLRRIGVLVVLLVLAGVVAVLGCYAPGWLQLLTGAVAVLGLARVGRPADKPIVGTAVVIPQAPRLTDAIVSKALASVGITE
ncbi:MAG: cell division protein FtsK, partial [Pseudonocardiaceae bacterium]